MIVRGRAAVEDVHEPLDGAVLVVRLVDVSRADAASVTMAQAEIDDVHVDESGQTVDFELDAPGVEPRHRYAVEAHLDATGSRTITPGDYLTMESFPVDPGLSEATVDVRLRFVQP